MFCALGITVRNRLGFFLVQYDTSFHLYHKWTFFSELIKQCWLVCNHHHSSCCGFCGGILLWGSQKLLPTSQAEMLCFQLFFMPLLCTAQNVFDSKLCAQKNKCQREGAEKKNAIRAFLIHKMSMLTRFDSSIVSKSSCVSCVFGF